MRIAELSKRLRLSMLITRSTALFAGLAFFFGHCFCISTNSYAEQSEHLFKRNVEQQVKYLLYLPDTYDSDLDESFPLLLFLHGGGQVGDDLDLVKEHGPPALIDQGQDFPFLVLSPQNPIDKLWDDKVLIELLNEIIEKYHVDEDRIYLTGLSRGAFGAWRLAIQYPEKFAALVPICGGGTPTYARRIKGLPTWVFHGAKDQTVPLSKSVEMVEALQDCGGIVKLTVYPEADHDSWTETYNNPELYTWLLNQSKKNRD